MRNSRKLTDRVIHENKPWVKSAKRFVQDFEKIQKAIKDNDERFIAPKIKEMRDSARTDNKVLSKERALKLIDARRNKYLNLALEKKCSSDETVATIEILETLYSSNRSKLLQYSCTPRFRSEEENGKRLRDVVDKYDELCKRLVD